MSMHACAQGRGLSNPTVPFTHAGGLVPKNVCTILSKTFGIVIKKSLELTICLA